MFKRLDKDPNDPTLIEAWKGGPVTIAIRAYAFGQYRIQLWYDNEHSAFPDILGPEC